MAANNSDGEGPIESASNKDTGASGASDNNPPGGEAAPRVLRYGGKVSHEPEQAKNDGRRVASRGLNSAQPVGRQSSIDHDARRTHAPSADNGRRGIFVGFMICLTIGLACQVNPIRELSWLKVLGPALMTLVYASWGALTGQHKKPWREQFADNCYFLGFIFTLLSLCVAFAPVAFGVREINAQYIIDQFGVGLLASVVGLLARTAFQNLQPDVAEMQRSVEDKVIGLAETMAGQFQKIAGMLDQIESSAAGHMKRMQDLDASIVSRFDGAASSAASLGAETDRQGAVISGAVEAFTSNLLALQEQFAKTGDSSRTKIDAISDELSTAARSMKELLEDAGAMRKAGKNVSDEYAGLSNRLNQLSTSFDNVSREIGSIAEAISLTPGNLNTSLSQSIEQLQASLRSHAEKAASSTAQSTQKASEELDQLLRGSIENLRVVVDKFNDDVIALKSAASAGGVR